MGDRKVSKLFGPANYSGFIAFHAVANKPHTCNIWDDSKSLPTLSDENQLTLFIWNCDQPKPHSLCLV